MAETQPFEQMTPTEKRVAIAFDLIAHVNAGKVRPANGVYMLAGREDAFVPGDRRQLCAVLADLPFCECCQLGGLLYATALRADAVTVGEVCEKEVPSEHLAEYGFRHYLARFFSDGQLCEMEEAFEGWDGSGFYEAHPTPSARMVAICENIIANGGEFVMPVEMQA